MARCRAADEFVNCVTHRGDRDMLLKPSLIILAIVFPLVFGFALSFAITTINDTYGAEDVVDENQLATVVMTFIVELCIVSFMIYCVSRRNRNHLKRDIVWMTSLCDFVDFHHGDSEDMRKILKKSSRATNRFASTVSLLIWLVYVVFMIAVGIAFLSADVSSFVETATLEAYILTTTVILLVLLLIDFIVTIVTVIGFPAKHDKNQTRFTKELREQCAKFGFDADVMEHDVRRRHQWIHYLLMVVTIGVYGIVYLIIACRDMNKHLLNQWEYETDLMERMVEFEGGTGIEATSEGEKSKVGKLISGLM